MTRSLSMGSFLLSFFSVKDASLLHCLLHSLEWRISLKVPQSVSSWWLPPCAIQPLFNCSPFFSVKGSLAAEVHVVTHALWVYQRPYPLNFCSSHFLLHTHQINPSTKNHYIRIRVRGRMDSKIQIISSGNERLGIKFSTWSTVTFRFIVLNFCFQYAKTCLPFPPLYAQVTLEVMLWNENRATVLINGETHFQLEN